LCKHHYSQRIKQQLQRTIVKTYRNPEYAFTSIDFTGRGFILEDELLNKFLL